jgi:N-acetylglucosaminyl-diphospho-decaprenol L-rhamnosyltransferase
MSAPPTTAPELSVVVVTYNSAQTIEACLNSLSQCGASCEVVVVDNASADGSAALVRERVPSVKLIASPTNEGFGRGCNRGWQATSAPFVLVLNPDSELQPGAGRVLLDFAVAYPRAGLIGPRILNRDGTLQQSCFRFPSLRQAVTGFFGLIPLDSPANGRYRREDYERAHEVEHLLGACLLVRRAAAEAVGLLDEDFYMYFEETDWCYRMRAAGWQNWYCPSASAIHLGAHSTSREPERMSAEFYRSQARFYRKHYSLAPYLALKLIKLAGIAYWSARTLRGLLRGRVSLTTLRRRLASYWTIVWT